MCVHNFCIKKISLILIPLILGGCARYGDIKRPEVNYALAYQASHSQETQVINQQWWEAFHSTTLSQLIQDAENHSPDLLIAAERVRQAELQMRIANASLFPALTARAETGESRKKNANDVVEHGESTSVSLNVSYEVDLWGGLAAERASAKAGYAATRYDQEAAALSVKAAIASGWFQWLAVQERISTTQKNIEIAERVQNIVDARYRNGVTTAADVAQQKTNLLTQQAALLPLQLQARQTQSALAILLGKTPQELHLPTENLLSVTVPVVAPGTPADLVMRRPDLAARDADLVGASADIVRARAALLPSIGLSAGAGRSASELFRLNPATQSSSWSLSLAQTLFNGGALLNQKRLTESQREIILLEYHKAILVALQEVDDGLTNADISAQQEIMLREIVDNASRSLRLTETRYREGSDDLLALLETQRSLFQAQDSLVQQRLARLNAAVDLYKALGGGWRMEN